MISMELTAAEAWARILERARALLPEQTYRIWLEHTEPVALSQDVLSVAAGSEFAAEWIEDKYGDFLADLSERLFERRLTIVFEHREPRPHEGAAAVTALTARAPATAAPTSAPAAPAPLTPVLVGAPLNDRYIFDRFVVGANNQLAA